ncbi:DUF2938 family protein [Alphaproteobacteria bacterium]|nr:DUF2938 family protein [Alphaproteobacteria bacterium]
MLISQGLISGIIATIIFDLFNISLKFAYNIDKPKWNFLGRYFLGYKEGRYIRKSLQDDDDVENELLWGYIIHYLIGIIYGLFYVFINLLIFDYPSLLIAYVVGFITVLGAWCYLMPFAYNLGFFASKSDQQFKTLTQNLIGHFIFGTGLFIGFYISF